MIPFLRIEQKGYRSNFCPPKITVTVKRTLDMALKVGGDLLACGGAHRLIAAQNLGLPIKLRVLESTNDMGEPELHVQHYLAAQPDISNLNLWSVDVEIADEAAAA
jgi:hypothetical protein